MVQTLDEIIANGLDEIAKGILDAEVEAVKLLLKPIGFGVNGLGYLLCGTLMILASPYILAFGYNNHRKLRKLYDINPKLYKRFINERMSMGEMPIPMHWMTNKEIENFLLFHKLL